MGTDRKKARSAAQKHVRKGNWNKAITEYEKLVDEDGSDVRSRLKLADLYTRVGNEDEAIESYKSVGRHHASQDFYQKAVAVYKQAIRLQPEDGDLHRRVGEAYHRLDRLKDAAEAYRDAQRRYKQAGDRDKQQKVLEELTRIDPEDVSIHIQLAECYAKEGDRGGALDEFRTAADMLDEEGRVDDYVQVAERILYFDPDDVDVRKKAIDIYLDRSDNKRALKHLHVCFNNNPEDEDILRKLAETFLKLDRDQKAVLVFQQLAKLYRKRDRADSERRIWERILEIDPDHEKAKKGIRALGGDPTGQEPTPEQPEAGQSQGRSAPPEEDEPSDDALEGVEFIDEEPDEPEPAPSDQQPDQQKPPPEPDKPAGQQAGADRPPPPAESSAPSSEGRTGAESDDIERVDVEQLDDDAVEPAEQPSTTTREPAAETPSDDQEPIDISDSIEPVETQPADGGQQQDEDLSEMISEADVFIRYGLYDNAREVIQNVLSRDPENTQAYEKRRELYAALDEPRAEASTLLELAKLCHDQSNRAQKYLNQALQLGVIDDQVLDVAGDLGIALAGGSAAQPSRPSSPEHSGRSDRSAPPEQTAEPEPIEDVQELDPDEVEELEPEPVDEVQDVESDPIDEIRGVEPDAVDEVQDVESEPVDEVQEREAGQDDDLEEFDSFDDLEEVDAIEEVAEAADEDAADEVVELDPNDVDMVEEEPETSSQADGGAGEFPDIGGDVVENSGFVIEESGDDDFDDELEAVSDLSEDTQPDATPPPDDQRDPMAQTDFDEPAEGLSFTEEEVEGALDGLFDSLAEKQDEPVNVGEDDPEGELAQVDFYIQQELYDEAIEALEEFEEANPSHPGIDQRYYQIKTARQGGAIEEDPSGAASLSNQFEPVEPEPSHDQPAEATDTDPDEPVSVDSDVLHTNFELGAAYRDMGMYDDAINEFQQALDDPDAAPEARYHIAVCKAEQGDTGEAVDTLGQLLQNGDLSEDLRSAARDKLDEIDGRRA